MFTAEGAKAMTICQKTKPTALRHVIRLLSLILLCSTLAACATDLPATAKPRTAISWPLTSSLDRVVWVKNITGPADIGSGTGFWQRLQESISSPENNAIGRPYGLLRAATGVIYLADPGRGIVHCLDITNKAYSVIGSREGAPLVSPIGLAEDTAGRIYITDSMAAIVYRFTPGDGTLKPLQSQQLERPTGITFNPVNKLLYVADTLASQIVVLDQNGIIVKRINGRALGGEAFNRPTDIAVDARGQIYVTDSLNFRITILTPEGQVVSQFGSPGDSGGSFSRPKGIAVDSYGNIYANDSLMDAVQIFDQNGALLLMFGSHGSEPGQFLMPSGLFIDRLDQIYVADTYNRRIQIFRYLAGGDDADEGNNADLFDKPLVSGR